MDNREQLKQRVLAALDTESIGKYDFTAVFAEGGLAGDIVEYLAAPYIGKVDYVAGPESLGFVLGSMLARRLGVGFITLRKGGKLPYGPERLVYSDYVDYTGHTKRLEMRGGILKAGDRVLVADDWMETAATIGACVSVVEKAGGTLAGVAVIGGDLRPESRALIEKGLLRWIILED